MHLIHRGIVNKRFKENLLKSFKQSFKKGYGVETDVHATKDGEFVCFHDFTLKKIFKKNLSIKNLDYSKINEISSKFNKPIPLLKDLLNLNENSVTIDIIQTVVCKFFKISKNEMLSSRRSRYLVRPRQTAIYLTKILTTKSLPEIGREFSNRDHTTIIHSVKTIEKLKEDNPEINDNINKLKNIILYNKQDEI